MVLTCISRLRLGQHPGNLLGNGGGCAVGLQCCVRPNFGSVQGHQAEPDQSCLPAQLQHGQEHPAHLLDVTPAEPRDHRVVWNLRADDEPIACVAPAQPPITRLERLPCEYA